MLLEKGLHGDYMSGEEKLGTIYENITRSGDIVIMPVKFNLIKH